MTALIKQNALPIPKVYTIRDALEFSLPIKFFREVETRSIIGIKKNKNSLFAANSGTPMRLDDKKMFFYWEAYKTFVDSEYDRWIFIKEEMNKDEEKSSIIAYMKEDKTWESSKTMCWPNPIPKFNSGILTGLCIDSKGKLFSVDLHNNQVPSILYGLWKIVSSLMNPGYVPEIEAVDFAISAYCDKIGAEIPDLLPYQLGDLAELAKSKVEMEYRLNDNLYNSTQKLLGISQTSETEDYEKLKLETVYFSSFVESFKETKQIPNEFLEVIPDFDGLESVVHFLVTLGHLNILLPDGAIPEVTDIINSYGLPENLVHYFPVEIEEEENFYVPVQ